jgi:hypothetical protein
MLPKGLVVVDQNGVHNGAYEISDDSLAGHFGVALKQPLMCHLLEPISRQTGLSSFADIYREALFHVLVELPQSHELDGPPLMLVQRLATPIKCTQGRQIGRFLHELATQMTEENRWDILEGVKGRTGHGDKSRLQGDADPMTRPELFTDHSPLADTKSEPLSQLEFAEASRKLVPSDVG